MVTAENKDCFSQVGRRGTGPQQLNLEPGTYCMWKQTIQHEFMHALGLYHMQARPDRDQYVTIHWNNIPASSRLNFQIMANTLSYDIPYNGRSMMHYFWNSHAINPNLPTITSKVCH